MVRPPVCPPILDEQGVVDILAIKLRPFCIIGAHMPHVCSVPLHPLLKVTHGKLLGPFLALTLRPIPGLNN